MKNYIQELLYEHNSVIIPSFGGFTASYKPASIDHVQGVIFPPSKDLKFNRYLTINDGVLVQHICESKGGWTRAEAETALQDWVAEMKGSLERREMLEFPKVGRLYLDYEGNFRFLQDNTNYNRASFGLPTVGFYPVTRNRQAPVEEAPQPRPTAAILELGGEPSRSKMISGWFYRNVPYLVAASVLILTGTFITMNNGQDTNQTALNSLVKPVSEERLNIKPQYEEESDITTLYPEDMIGESSVGEEEMLEEPKKQAYEPVVEEDIDTEGATIMPEQEEGIVIIGSFGSKKNVDRLVKKIYSKGYEPFTERKGKLTRIGVRFGYGNLREVDIKKREVAKDFKAKAWVLQPEIEK